MVECLVKNQSHLFTVMRMLETCLQRPAQPGWQCWSSGEGLFLNVENQYGERAQSGNVRAGCPGLQLRWVCGGGTLGATTGEGHDPLISPSPFPSPHVLSVVHPHPQTLRGRSHFTALNKPNLPSPGILPHCCLHLPAGMWGEGGI